MTQVISFQDAIDASSKYKKRLLLLGNGFSISCFPNIFRYGTLYEQADFSQTPEIPRVFQEFKTTDFEVVIRALEEVIKVAPLYGGTSDAAVKKMRAHAEELKNILVRTIASRHPDFPAMINEAQVRACRRFLSNFLGSSSDGKVYSFNYDLLLYWVLMHDDKEGVVRLRKNDGFGRDEDTLTTEYVVWKGEDPQAHSQSVYYLHGALHLFDAGSELQKYTWKNTGIPLVKQIRAALDSQKYPLFVAEGTHTQKLTKIQHSAYLHHAYKSFSSEVNFADKCLFIHGHSLADNDAHVLKKIVLGKIPELYISIHGNFTKENNLAIFAAAEELVKARGGKYPLKITYYDAESAAVWG